MKRRTFLKITGAIPFFGVSTLPRKCSAQITFYPNNWRPNYHQDCLILKKNHWVSWEHVENVKIEFGEILTAHFQFINETKCSFYGLNKKDFRKIINHLL